MQEIQAVVKPFLSLFCFLMLGAFVLRISFDPGSVNIKAKLLVSPFCRSHHLLELAL